MILATLPTVTLYSTGDRWDFEEPVKKGSVGCTSTIIDPSAKWGVHTYATYAIYRLLQILRMKLHISPYFHCIFFAYSINTVYIFAYFLQIFCISLAADNWHIPANFSILPAYLCIFLAYFVHIFCIFD